MRKKDDPLFSAIFPLEADKSQQRKLQIVEAAITNYVKLGIEKTTFDVIAKTCKISRPLIMHYFSDKQAIYELAIQLIRANLQQISIVEIQKHVSPRAQLEAYVRSVFNWVQLWPDHARVWLLFYYYASIRSSDRKQHTELAEMGHRRITSILEEAEKTGCRPLLDRTSAAKMIQIAITGGFVAFLSEEGRLMSRKKIVESTVETSLLLAGMA